MNTLLIFFAFPIATIILAIVLEKIIRNPILTALTFFAIYLIVTFAVFDATFLVYVILYTVLAFVAAYVSELFYSRCRRIQNGLNNNLGTNDNNCCNCNLQQNETVTANLINNANGNRSSWCCYRRN